MSSTRQALFAGLGLLALVSACGGSSTSPSSISVIVRDGGSGGANGATVTLTGAGASPLTVTVSAGQTVTFVNNDNRTHEIDSDPHPQHGSCPSIEGGVGTLAAGQTKVTHAFANSGTCHYHDHLDASNSAFIGTIVVQ